MDINEAKEMLRIDGEENDPLLILILAAIDQYVLNATGQDFSGNPLAKMAAGMLLVMWFENPSMIGKVGETELTYGLNNILAQLQATALPEVVA